VHDGEIYATFVLLRNGVRFYLKRYVKSQKDKFSFFVYEMALRDVVGGVWYDMSAALTIGLPFFSETISHAHTFHLF
jgi:hypothetical protein